MGFRLRAGVATALCQPCQGSVTGWSGHGDLRHLNWLADRTQLMTAQFRAM